MTKIKAILFDKDGTLINFEKTFGPALSAILKIYSNGVLSLQQRLGDAVGFDVKTNAFSKDSIVIAGSNFDIAEVLSVHLSDKSLDELSYELDEQFEQLTPHHVVAIDGLERALEQLKRAGYRLGIATNDSEENARLHMRKLGQENQFDFYVGYNSGFGAKPDPGMVNAFAEFVGVAPEEVAMVGDSLHDLKTARNAGCFGIAVTTGFADEAILSPQAEIILSDISQLPEALNKIGSAENQAKLAKSDF